MQPDAQENGWLLDGYPRSLSQAKALEDLGIQPDLFILLDVSNSSWKKEELSNSYSVSCRYGFSFKLHCRSLKIFSLKEWLAEDLILLLEKYTI